jgi:Protein of unknown function (DUF4238)
MNTPIKKKQHFLPCCYLKHFSLNPAKGRDSVIYRFNGKSSEKSIVGNEGLRNFTYSRKNPNTAEDFFEINYEDNYSHIAERVTNGYSLRAREKFNLFQFALITKFRSPSYIISTDEERIETIESIMGSALNQITPIRSDDWKKGNEWNHMRRVYSSFHFKMVELPIQIYISDNPCHIYNKGDVFMAAILLPITPRKIAVFYRYAHVTCQGSANENDVKHLLIRQRQSRMHFLYYPLDLNSICRPDEEMPASALDLSKVTSGKITHHFHVLDGSFDFLK